MYAFSVWITNYYFWKTMGSSGSVEWTNAMFRWVSDHPLPLSFHPSYWPFCPKVTFSCVTALMICLMLHPSTLVYLALKGFLPRTCFVPIVRAIWNCIDAFFQSVRSYGSNGYLCTWSYGSNGYLCTWSSFEFSALVRPVHFHTVRSSSTFFSC